MRTPLTTRESPSITWASPAMVRSVPAASAGVAQVAAIATARMTRFIPNSLTSIETQRCDGRAGVAAGQSTHILQMKDQIGPS